MANSISEHTEQALLPDDNNLLPFVQTEDDELEEGITIIAGGLCEPNPGGIATWGFAVFCLHGNLSALYAGVIGSGENITNNVAEYAGVLQALDYTVDCFPDAPVEILTDSELVACQINGKRACKKPHLKVLRDHAVDLLKQSKAVVRWVPKAETHVVRALNELAYHEVKRERDGGDDE